MHSNYAENLIIRDLNNVLNALFQLTIYIPKYANLYGYLNKNFKRVYMRVNVYTYALDSVPISIPICTHSV